MGFPLKKWFVVIVSVGVMVSVIIGVVSYHNHQKVDNWNQLLETSSSINAQTGTQANSQSPGYTGKSTTTESPVNSDASPSTPQPEPSLSVMIDIKGAVLNPGVYTLSSDKRVMDAIEKAGGLQKEADVTPLNLAQHLSDEMVIYVPKLGEQPPSLPPIQASVPSSNQSTPSTDASNGQTKVHINTATETELETVPGIGPSKAKAILDFRAKNGPFSKLEDLTLITGIGDKTLERLKPYLDLK